MLPKGVENVLVAGIGFSADRDSSPVIRMQPDIQNNGYAAGLAAAIALRDKVSVRNINIQSLQRKLVKKGILDLGGISNKDSAKTTGDKLNTAIADLANSYSQVCYILDADRDEAIQKLRGALKKPENRLSMLS